MIKNILKEIIIILLLLIAIILIMGVLLYEYIPSNKIIPERVSYTTPESVQLELKQEESKIDDTLEITYHVDSTELYNYKKIQEYVPGKSNPFATYEKQEEINNEDQVSTNTNANINASTNTNLETNTNKGYLPDKGTK